MEYVMNAVVREKPFTDFYVADLSLAERKLNLFEPDKGQVRRM